MVAHVVETLHVLCLISSKWLDPILAYTEASVGLSNKNQLWEAFLLMLDLFCLQLSFLQSVKALVRRTFPLYAKSFNCK